MSELYMMISQCLDSCAYAGQEFEQRAYEWLEESQDKSPEDRLEGWIRLHAEYQELSKPHWEMLWKRVEDGRVSGLKQGELFA